MNNKIKPEVVVGRKPRLVGFVISVLVFFGAAQNALALMNSSNYQIWGDSVSAGGNRSVSGSYVVQDTIGETATGEDPTSSNYLLDAGFQALFPEPVLIMSVSAGTLALSPDPITSAAVSTGSYTVTVSTNAASGYSLAVIEDGDFRSGAVSIPDVADGAVTAGSNEYGISVAGTNPAFADHRAVSGTPLVVASSSGPISQDVYTMTHRVAATTSLSGSYSHVVTYVATGNF